MHWMDGMVRRDLMPWVVLLVWTDWMAGIDWMDLMAWTVDGWRGLDEALGPGPIPLEMHIL